MRQQYNVLKKGLGYIIKSFNSETKAREYADSCNTYNKTDKFSVYVWEGGVLVEI